MNRNHCLFSARSCFLFLFTASTLALVGCGRPTGSVEGKVTYNGKNLKGGSVTFVSTEGRQSFAAEIKEDGTYSVPVMTGGDYKVCVDTSNLKSASTSGTYEGKMKTAGPPAKKATAPPKDAVIPEGYTPSNPAEVAAQNAAKRYVEIPEKYRDTAKTDLTYKFEGGSQTFNIDLK
jgi:hypothetical protein